VFCALSPHDVAVAIGQLEREQFRLQEQLTLVQHSLEAYRVVQQLYDSGNISAAAPAAASPKRSERQPSPVPPRIEHGSATPSISPIPSQRADYRADAGSTAKVTRNSSELQTEQIYEELRLIRKAREEREAQRRAQMYSPNRH
jgi:hypothetical protein